jgi:hypothetical protein
MPYNTQALIQRADELVTNEHSGTECVQFAVTMLTTLYGPRSMQLKTFTQGLESISRAAPNFRIDSFNQRIHARETIKNAKGELQAGLIPSARVLVAGEVLSELLRLGKETLEDKFEGAKNVPAVLVAAAFEDLIRRIGEEFASVTGRPNLEAMITALKDADVLKGGQVGTAQSFLKFRNDSLHANWDNIDRSQVQSCVAFIEGLLAKHFS